MCNKRSSERIPVMAYSGEIRVDKCMRPIIDFLWHKDIHTVACCCGHGKYPMTILVRHDNGEVTEIISGRNIPRTRNFYKRNKQGFYFIPETVGDEKK